MTEEKYFWDEFDDYGNERFRYKLLQEKDALGLNEMYGAFATKYIPDCNTPEKWLSQESRERFFTYLLPLLQDGKLKVKIVDLEMRTANDEERQKYFKIHGRNLPENDMIMWRTKNEYSNLPPEQAVALIREKWNSFPTDFISVAYANRTPEQKEQAERLSLFEQWEVLFTLPQNEWAM